MSYQKATDVLPEELIAILQNYVDGEYLYIPRKESNKKNWGENTKTKAEYNARNNNIFNQYKNGIRVKELSHRFYLSEKSIQRIIAEKKREEGQPH